MAKGNPFTLMFGKVPDNYIDRITCVDTTVETFMSDNPYSQAFIFTGIRGCGKTVAMTAVANKLKEKSPKEWIVADLSIESDMLLQLASILDSNKSLHALFTKASVDFSIGKTGAGIKIENVAPSPHITTIIERMLDVVQKAGKKLLICVDEAANTEKMREFASFFSIFVRHPYPVYLLMTGLPDNISNLQNSKTLTFLLRTPKIVMEPLNFTLMRAKYAELLNCTQEEAAQLAVITKGYSLCFQLLGYHVWEEKCATHSKKLDNILPNVLTKLDSSLEQFAYGKIWSDISDVGRKIVIALAETAENRQSDVMTICDKAGLSSGMYNRYKSILSEKGVIDTSVRGVVQFALPRFSEFVISQNEKNTYLW